MSTSGHIEQAVDARLKPAVGSDTPLDDAAFALSSMQRAFWFDQRIQPTSIRHHLTTAVRLFTDADPQLLCDAIQTVVDAHPSLRTTFYEVDGRPVQRVSNDAQADCRIVDASGWSRSELDTALRVEHLKPFDLADRAPVRFVVFRSRPGELVLLFAIHHLITDMWSEALLGYYLVGALRDALNDEVPDRREGAAKTARRRTTVQDFVETESELCRSDLGDAARDYWRPVFESWIPQSIPSDRPPTADSTGVGAVQSVTLEPELAQALDRAAQSRGVTVRSMILTAFEITLARMNGQRRCIIAETKANRTLRTSRLLGPCINQTPRTLEFDGQTTVATAIDATEAQSIGSSRYDTVPIGWLLRELRPGHGSEPLFQASFSWHKTSRLVDARLTTALALGRGDQPVTLHGFSIEPVEMPARSAPLPLTMLAVTHGRQLHLSLEYQTERFDADTITRLGDRVKSVLHVAVHAPTTLVADLDMITQAEQDRADDEWERAQRPIDRTIATHHLFERCAKQSPAKTAVIGHERSLSYEELDREAERLRSRLTAEGVKPGDLVGICLERSVDLITSLLAVWKAGAGYVPMDPDFPSDRLAAMVDDAHVDCVITRRSIWNDVVLGLSPTETLDCVSPIELDNSNDETTRATSPPPVDVDGSQVAYVIFTSGSTGRPKGVIVEHANIINFVASMCRRPGLTEPDVVLATTTLSFDISVLEIVAPLTVGATIELVDRDTARDPLLLANALERVTVAQGTPTMWKMLIDSGWAGRAGLRVLCGGEPMTERLALELLDRCAVLWNMYGPTETTVWSSVEQIRAGFRAISIGEPIDNTRLVVLDDAQRVCPDGVAGELWIGGAGVARGYIDRSDLTAERFVDDPAGRGHGVLYRTGDLVRRDAHRNTVFLGRVDQQVKLRGHRIELGEIEAVLAHIDGILDAIAAVVDYGDDDRRLVAYYRVAPDRPDIGDETRVGPLLHAEAVRHLPAYMVPAAFVRMDEFPLTPNDKIDRQRLPHPGSRTLSSSSTTGVSTRPEDVDAVVDIFRKVFNDDTIAQDDDFFMLGGHSLLATRIVSRLRNQLGRDVPVRNVFDFPSPSLLASMIDSAPRVDQPAIPAPPQEDRYRDSTRSASKISSADGPYPLSFSQQRMWFLHAMHPASSAYNLVGLARIRGDVDLDAIKRAFDRLVERHTSLRTVFVEHDGQPVARVHDPFAVHLEIVDDDTLGNVEERSEIAKRAMLTDADRPFDLTRLPLFRVVAHRVAGDEVMLGITLHHIIADQWSFGVIANEIVGMIDAERRGETLELAPAPRAELYAQWQRENLQSDATRRLLDYWVRRLDGLVALELPSDRERPALMSLAGRTITRRLPAPLVDAVREQARQQRASEFMVEFAAFQLHLHRVCGATDIGVGVPIANRHWLASESLITSLVNTLVLRSDLTSTPTFAHLLAQVRDTTLEAYAHQDLPFERLIEAIDPARDPSRSPLFQIFFNAHNAPFDVPAVDGLDIEIVPALRHAAQFDLSVTIDTNITDTITLEYATDLFDHDRMSAFLDTYVDLLDEISTVGGGATPIEPASGQNAFGVPAIPKDADSDPDLEHMADRGDPPSPGLECRIAGIWEQALGVSGIGRHDDFFDLGGHSLLAVRIFAEVSDLTARRPPLSILFRAPTVASFTAALVSEGWLTPWTSLVEVRAGDDRLEPFFYVAPFLITALSFHELGQQLTSPRPFYALQPQGLETDDPVHRRVEDMAAHYIREMKTVQPLGPYVLGGHCAGAWVAFEMARQLQRDGDEVDKLVVVDVEPPGITPPRRDWLRYVVSRLALYGRSGRLLHALRWRVSMWRYRLTNRRATAGIDGATQLRQLHSEAHSRYQGGEAVGDITLVRSEEWHSLPDKQWHLAWQRLVSGDLHIDVVPGAHARLLDGEGVADLANVFDRLLEA